MPHSKRFMVTDGRGLFVIKDGKVLKSRPFGSSLRGFLLEPYVDDDGIERQWLNLALVIVLDQGGERVRAPFRQFLQTNADAIDYEQLVLNGASARDANGVTGLYLRSLIVRSAVLLPNGRVAAAGTRVTTRASLLTWAGETGSATSSGRSTLSWPVRSGTPRSTSAGDSPGSATFLLRSTTRLKRCR